MLGDRLKISIHAPRTGSDAALSAVFSGVSDFNPRSPHGERPDIRQHDFFASATDYFNPRSPHGERPLVSILKLAYNSFQSTLPARGATSTSVLTTNFLSFQSTLPARGATKAVACLSDTLANFNPRSPHGERREGGTSDAAGAQDFNPRSPHGERLWTGYLATKRS